MTLRRMSESNKFSCRSCNQALVDFREMTTEEIIRIISAKKVCGIFNADQVVVPEFSFKNNLIFKILTMLAVLGLNVKPLNAQTNQSQKDSITVQKQKKYSDTKTNAKLSTSDTTQNKSAKKRWWGKKKKPKYRTIGTPSF